MAYNYADKVMPGGEPVRNGIIRSGMERVILQRSVAGGITARQMVEQLGAVHPIARNKLLASLKETK